MNSTSPDPVRGRFAPTPSGPLHLGSLYTALAGYLDARRRGGQWLLRIDDLDTARCDADAVPAILAQLRAHGLHWDGEPRHQSARLADYEAALARLRDDARVYACRCSRRQLKASAPDGPDGPVYPGTCRARGLAFDDAAVRYRVPEGKVCLDDAILGRIERDADSEIGDFIVRRRDGPIAYQLASVVDDRLDGVNEVWRGHDLLGSSLRQLSLFAGLGAAAPRFAHVPVLIDAGGKLSKQHHAAPIDPARAGDNLRWCLAALGQDIPPPDRDTVPAIVAWAVEHWRREAVPRSETIDLDG